MKSNIIENKKSIFFPQGEKKFFGLMVNTNAGKVQSGSFDRDYFIEELGDQGIIKETKTLNEVAEALNEFQEKNIDIIYIYGGDGTQQKVISQMFVDRAKIPYVVPLKGGTMNMLVKDVGLGGSPKKVFRVVRDVYLDTNREMPFIKKPILRITVNSKESYYGFYFANGVIYKILQQYYQKPSSVYNACRVTVNGLLGSLLPFHSYSNFFDSINCTVDHDGKILCENRFLGMMISTLNRVVFGMKPFIKKNQQPNEIAFMGYSFDKRLIVPFLPFLATGMNLKNRNIHAMTFKEVKLNADTGFILDGELYEITEPSTIKIDIGGYLKIPMIA